MANTLKFGNGNWATKEDSVLAYNDENNNFKPLPFDFTRASTATYVDSDGLIKTARNGEARIDYTDSTDGALLLEPARTNLLSYSEDFSNVDWIKLAAGTSIAPIVTLNNSISPDGTQNATRLQCDLNGGTSSGDQSLIYFIPSGSSNTYTNSFYVKGVSGQTFAMGRDLANKKTILTDGTWQRVDFSYNITPITFIGLRGTSGSDDVLDIEIYGAQLEQGSYATSYIPTSGSTVTRVAESCSQTPTTGIIGQTEGTMYAEIDFKSKPEAGSPIVGIITLNNNVNNLQNAIILGIERQSGGTNRFYPLVQVGNSTVAYVIGSALTDGFYKVAFAYKQNDFVLYVNGVQIGTASSGAVPTTSQVLVGERFNGDTIKFSDGIKDTKLYNTRLSNSELATLTT